MVPLQSTPRPPPRALPAVFQRTNLIICLQCLKSSVVSTEFRNKAQLPSLVQRSPTSHLWGPLYPLLPTPPCSHPLCCSHKEPIWDAMFLWLHMGYSLFCFLPSPQLGKFSPAVTFSKNSPLPPSRLIQMLPPPLPYRLW